MENLGALLILGGRSDIGGEIAQRLSAGRDVVLAARPKGEAHRPGAALDDAALAQVSATLQTAGARSVHMMSFDAADMDAHAEFLDSVEEAVGPIGTAVVCFGILGSQEQAEVDSAHVREIAVVDYAAQVSILTELAQRMEQPGGPQRHIIAFSSIAGWRARRANYVYGSTKAGLDAFCQGLMDRLHGSNVAMVLARPGFVIGSMTTGMKPAPLSVTPDVVAERVVAHMRTKPRKSATLWIPGALRALAYVMAVVPRPIWRHMPR